MGSKLRWLLAIIIVELLVIVGLVIWAVIRPSNNPNNQTTSTVSIDSGELSAALVATSFEAPTTIATAPDKADERLFIAERIGTIKTINKNGGGDGTTFLDIRTKVKDNGSEMGLLGLAFHPKFAENGYFFVNYTDKQDNTIIARFQVEANGQVDPATEKVLIKLKQPYENHNGGALAFGPDGFLYAALGDGGSGGDPQNNSQNKNTLLGKILRLDVDSGDPYAIPASNPFVNESGAKPEIWAYGLRNPWRISFDRQTGDLYIADVGQNKIEEVDVQKAASKGGENYGWRCYEGTQAFNSTGNCAVDISTFVMPQLEYAHDEGRCSIAGGYLYRGQQMSSLIGTYIYGDTCSGEIFSAKQTGDTWSQTLLLKTPYYISTFGEDQNGELYIADLQSGSIYKLNTF